MMNLVQNIRNEIESGIDGGERAITRAVPNEMLLRILNCVFLSGSFTKMLQNVVSVCMTCKRFKNIALMTIPLKELGMDAEERKQSIQDYRTDSSAFFVRAFLKSHWIALLLLREPESDQILLNSPWEMTREVLKRGYLNHWNTHVPVMIWAIQKDDLEIIQWLLVNPQSKVDHNQICVSAAVEKANERMVKLLLADERMQQGDRDLVVASSNGHAEIVRALLTRTRMTDAALISAINGGHEEIVRILL